jgi:hypothetical protein
MSTPFGRADAGDDEGSAAEEQENPSWVHDSSKNY